MKRIVTIGGGSGHSSILRGFYKILGKEKNSYHFTSIVSMSDDGRTTGLLMREMQDKLGIHLPPPGDLRKCMLATSSSEYRDEYSSLFERVLELPGDIIEYRIIDMLEALNTHKKLINDIREFNPQALNFILPLRSEIAHHKFGNIMFASLYYNYRDYNKMLSFMKSLLQVKWEVLPITTDKASIYGEAMTSSIIDTQDRISNDADYAGAIKRIHLSRDSRDAKIAPNVKEAIIEADYIIIGPGDLFTSIGANFLIENMSELVSESPGKKIYIMNSNNKTGETTDYNELDFIYFIVNTLGIKLDLIVANNRIPELNEEEEKKFRENISVKGGRYLCIDTELEEKIKKKYEGVGLMLGEYIDESTLYKNNDKMIEDLINWMNS